MIKILLIMSLVSVIIPYYKKKLFIKDAILSILKQTYKNLEIIIVYDDENLDDLKYIKEIVNRDKRIKLIINNKNIGAGQSRNKGINHGKGNFIAFLDSDDLWRENKLEVQLNFMEKNNYKISHTSYELIDLNNRVIGIRKARSFFNFEDLLKSCDIGLSTVILNKKLINNDCYFSDMKTKEDFVLWLKILKQRYTIGGLDNNLTYWRKLDNSLSVSVIQKLLDGFKVYNIHMKFNILKSIYYLCCLSLNYLRK